jgi:hypothetical protein
MKRKIFLLLLLVPLTTLLFGKGGDRIIYHIPSEVEQKISSYVNSLRDTIGEYMYACVYDVSAWKSDTTWITVIVSKNKTTHTYQLAKKTDRFLLIKGILIPLVFDSDDDYSDVMNPLSKDGQTISKSDEIIDDEYYIKFKRINYWKAQVFEEHSPKN